MKKIKIFNSGFKKSSLFLAILLSFANSNVATASEKTLKDAENIVENNDASSAYKDKLIFVEDILASNQENPFVLFYIAENEIFYGNFDKALSYYIKSAEKDFEPALRNVYSLLKENKGVTKNIDSVVNLLNKKGLKGDLFAQMYLGDLYRNGVEGVKYQEDYEKSYYWYSEAALQSDDRAEFYVGTMTLKGLGTPQNIPASLSFLEKLAEKSHYGASYLAGKIYKLGYYINQNHKLALKYFEQGAKYGHVLSMYEYADSLERGYGTKKSVEQALSWFESASEYDHGDSAYRAGLIHVYKSSQDPDFYSLDKGMQYLEKASSLGVPDANILLGDIYFEGKFGKAKDYKLAESYYTKSVGEDSKIGYKKLSMIYRSGGFGVEKDTQKYKEVMRMFYEYKPSNSNKNLSSLFDVDLFNYDGIF